MPSLAPFHRFAYFLQPLRTDPPRCPPLFASYSSRFDTRCCEDIRSSAMSSDFPSHAFVFCLMTRAQPRLRAARRNAQRRCVSVARHGSVQARRRQRGAALTPRTQRATALQAW